MYLHTDSDLDTYVGSINFPFLSCASFAWLLFLLPFQKMAQGRGGARHFGKPYVDPGLLYVALSSHCDLVKDLGTYELMSRTQGVDPKGLVKVLDLVKALVWKVALRSTPMP